MPLECAACCPPLLYPSHTTILTGVWPAKHGIYSNLAFDPLSLNAGGWLSYAQDIAVRTLWDAGSQAGLKVGSVSWPVSVGARSVDYLIPEYWRAPKFGDDIKLLRALSTPGMMTEIEKPTQEEGRSNNAGCNTPWRGRTAAWTPEEYAKGLLGVHQQDSRYPAETARQQPVNRTPVIAGKGSLTPRHKTARPCPVRAALHRSDIATGGSGG